MERRPPLPGLPSPPLARGRVDSGPPGAFKPRGPAEAVAWTRQFMAVGREKVTWGPTAQMRPEAGGRYRSKIGGTVSRPNPGTVGRERAERVTTATEGDDRQSRRAWPSAYRCPAKEVEGEGRPEVPAATGFAVVAAGASVGPLSPLVSR
jgi:hypothetical protein